MPNNSMFTADIFLHTAQPNPAKRAIPKAKPSLTVDTKKEVLRAFDELSSRIKSKKSITSNNCLKSSSSSSLFPSSSPSKGDTGPLPAPAISTADDFLGGLAINVLDEPRTPEDQILGFSDQEAACNVRTPFTVPGLTPDHYNPLSKLRPIGGTRSHSIRRKPVPCSSFSSSDNSKVLPLRLFGSANKPTRNEFETSKDEVCGFCDMPVSDNFKTEASVRMQCGHTVHRDCFDNLFAVCMEFEEESPKCTICEGSISSISQAIDVSLATDNFEPGSSKAGTMSPSRSALVSTIPATHSTTSQTAFSVPTKYPASASNYFMQPKSLMLAEILSPATQSVTSKPNIGSLSSRRTLKDTLAASLSISKANNHSNTLSIGHDYSSFSASVDSATSGTTESSLRSCSSGSALLSPSTHKNIDDFGLYHDALDKIFETEHTGVLQDETCSYSVNTVFHVSPPDGSSSKEKISQLAMWLKVPELTKSASKCTTGTNDNFRLQCLNYRSSANDVEYAIDLKRKVDSLEYRNRTLKSAHLGFLRLTSQLRITSPERQELDWPNADAFLFDKTLVLVTRHNNRVRAVLDASVAIKSAEIHPEDSTVLCLKSTSNKIPELHFQTESRAVVLMWKHALSIPTAQFPILPSNYDAFIEEMETEIELKGGMISATTTNRAPAEIVLCLPSYLVGSALSIQQELRDVLNRMGPTDKLSLVLYSSQCVKKIVGLQKRYWNGWSGIFDELDKARYSESDTFSQNSRASPRRSTSRPVKTFNELLHTVVSVLENHNIHESSASVLLVSDDDTKLGEIPSQFINSRVPIHTIGVSENHDALTLSTLARSTGGIYVYSKESDGLGLLMNKIIQIETKYVTDEIIVRFKPRIGTEMKNIRQTVLDGEDNQVKFNSSSKMTEWRLNKMRRGDTYCILFDICGPIAENHPLLQVSVETANALGKSPAHAVFRATAPLRRNVSETISSATFYEETQKMYEVESVLYSSFKTFEEVLAALIMQNNRRAFNTLQSGLDVVRKYIDGDLKSPTASNSFVRICEILELLLDQQCDQIIEHKLLTKDFVLESLQRLWLLKTRRSLASRDELEAIFQ